MTETLSLSGARRMALAAQGFGSRAAPDDRRKVLRAVDRTGLLQIDSVGAVVRSHYLPTFSRQGSYGRAELDRLQAGRRRRLFEYWGHEASLIPVEFWPLLQWRMARARAGEGVYSGLARFGRDRAEFIAAVLREVEARGPLAAGELTTGGRQGPGGWWGWSDGKRALEWLFWAGLVTTAARRGFERLYDLPERVLPAALVGARAPEPAEAQRALLRIAARAQGLATERDLRDYWRLGPAEARARLAELVEDGALLPVAVQGWREPAFLDPNARRSRRVEATALLSPFDSLIWFRPRAERLWAFRFRLEIYTPAEKRVHGYYVLPFLHSERIQARLDVRSVRAAGRLDVHAVHLEAGADADVDVHVPLAAEVRRMADWLGLAGVRTPDLRLRAALDGCRAGPHMTDMRLLPALALAFALCSPQDIAAQVLLGPGADLRLQNELRWQQGQIRALEAEAGQLRTDQTLRRLESRRLPDATLSRRQAEQDVVEAQNLLRATQAASTANAARLRSASPAYDQRLRELGYATSLPLAPRR